MNKLQYQLRSSSLLSYSLLLPLIVLTFSLPLLSLPILVSPSEMVTTSILFIFAVLVFLMPILFFLSYKNLKQTQLIIDIDGIRTSSKFLNMMPKMKPFNFCENTKIYRVEELAKTILGNMAKIDSSLRDDDVALVAIKGQKHTQKIYLISDNNWEINSIDNIQDYLQQQGFSIESVLAQDFINSHLPQFSDMGKQTGYMAYSSIFILIIAMGLISFDSYSTIYYGLFQHSIWLVALFSGLSSLWVIKEKSSQLLMHIIVSSIFAISISFLYLIIILIVVPIKGTQHEMTFEYIKDNVHGEEQWQSIDNKKLKFYCSKAENTEHEAQKTTVYEFLGVKRVNGDTLCLDSKFLNDGTLPHE